MCRKKLNEPLEPRTDGQVQKSMTQKELNRLTEIAKKHIASCHRLEDLAFAISKECEYTEEEIFECYIDDILNNL